MEPLACMIGGALLMACGLGLFKLRPPDWQADGELAPANLTAIQRWAVIQRAVRLVNNLMLFAIGAAIVASGFIPHGQIWMILWGVILVLLLICILLAMLDAFSSLAGYRRALPDAARRSLYGQQDHPSS